MSGRAVKRTVSLYLGLFLSGPFRQGLAAFADLSASRGSCAGLHPRVSAGRLRRRAGMARAGGRVRVGRAVIAAGAGGVPGPVSMRPNRSVPARSASLRRALLEAGSGQAVRGQVLSRIPCGRRPISEAIVLAPKRTPNAPPGTALPFAAASPKTRRHGLAPSFGDFEHVELRGSASHDGGLPAAHL